MGSGLCTPKNVIMVEYDESNRVKNFTIHGCYYYAPLEFQFKRPLNKTQNTVSGEVCCDSIKTTSKYNAKKETSKVVPMNTTRV